MADPTTTDVEDLGNAADKSKTQLSGFTDVAQKAQDVMSSMGTIINGVTTIFKGFENELQHVGLSLNNTKSFTDNQVKNFSLISNAVFGAREAYVGLANVDYTGINTFSTQAAQLFKIIGEGPATQAGKDAVDKIVMSLKKLGQSDADISKAMGKGTDFFLSFAKSVFTSADNTLRLQNVFIQMAARTGELNNVTSLAGDRFENINALLEKQGQMMSRAQKATGLTRDEVEKYYAELGSVPGALQAVVESTGSASESTELLTAAIKVARGTGRDFRDVIGDMKDAFRTYGLVGGDALKFSARISEVTQHLGVELTTVQSALKDTAGTFRLFANAGADAARMTDGIAGIMTSYADALKSTGLNGTQAVDVVKNMTNQLGNLTIAQKAFLSTQTGGAGGLMGAFQIDKMLREGRIGEVFEKVRQQMLKQFGNIVTVDEASKSPAAAAQLTRQIMLLRQGPMGQFARSDVEAERILEGFRARQTGGVSEKTLADDILNKSIDKGTALQEKSYTAVNEIAANVEAIRRTAEIGSVRFLQTELTGGKAAAAMKGAGYMSGNELGNSYAGATMTGTLSDTTGVSAVKAVMSFGSFLKTVPEKLKKPLDSLTGALEQGDMKEAAKQLAILEGDIKRRKIELAKLSGDKKKDAEDFLKQEEAVYMTASQQVGASVKTGVAAKKGSTPAPTPGTANTTASYVPLPTEKQQVEVHVTGFCLKCKQEIDNMGQPNSIAPQIKS